MQDDERSESRDDTAKSRISHFGSLIGHATFATEADGTTRTVPEHETLPVVIPLWAAMPHHDADTVAWCIDLAAHAHPRVRAAAIGVFVTIARRRGALVPQADVIARVEAGLRDQDNEVRQEASRVADVLRVTLGWDVATA